MGNLEEIAKRLKDLKKYLRSKYGVTEIGVFGSYVRGEQTKKSDLDILVDYEVDIDLLDIINLENYLSDVLEQKVDLIPKTCIRLELKESVLNEVVAV